MRLRPSALLACVAGLAGAMGEAAAQQRFPPPDFESGYRLPWTAIPGARSLSLQYLDVGVLFLALGLACYFILRRRSRRAVLCLSLFSLGYFGFYRQGCICSIGSLQNVALGLADSSYAVPWTALAFFLAPLLVALFAGRAFCAAVCPHGALQDLVLIKPLKVPEWLEHGLGLLPYLYLGAGVAVAVTGSAFLICRYDPFVPLFRGSGSSALVALGAAFLLLGMFIGRPYCRFLCPYGALLKGAASVAKWRVRITPNLCVQCRLCEDACPYGAIQKPVLAPATPAALRSDRRRLSWLLALLPALVMSGVLLGARVSVPASRLSPTVALAERYLRQRTTPVPLGSQTAAALSLARAEQDPKLLLERASEIQRRFRSAGRYFGGWVGLVIGLKLVGLALRTRRTDYEPDRGACVACARCFEHCPNERVRCGLALVQTAGANRDELIGPAPAVALPR
jgi:NosR/NirI family nitrous oxide reductase transcriptional regulator